MFEILRYTILVCNEPIWPSQHLSHWTQLCLCVQRSDMLSAQRLCNMTSEVLHSLSHVYHHVSDLMVDMSRTPPRNLHAPPPMPTTAIIQQTIPVQA